MPVAAPLKNEMRATQSPTSFQLVEAHGKGRLRKPSTSWKLLGHCLRNMMKSKRSSAPRLIAGVVALCLLSFAAQSDARQSSPIKVKDHYVKSEHRITMRDGVKLYTVVYSPKDASQKYPVLMTRTPYGAGPYGADAYRPSLGPSAAFMREGYIFVYQDVRGTFLSEGEFEDVRPHIPNKKSHEEIDESSDTYDTIDWLVKNIPNNNGRVGVWGISYPGFYTA